MKKMLLFTVLVVFGFFVNVQSQQKIAWIINDEAFSVIQTGLIGSLEDEGYTVEMVSTSIPFDYATLATYDLVVISRTVYSGAFNEPDLWAELEAPVLMLSPYVLGANDALGYYFGENWQGVSVSEEGTEATITQAFPLVDDPVFKGVTTDGAAFDFYTGFYNIPPYQISEFTETNNNGTPMLAIEDEAVLGGDSAVIMARWYPDEETFTESFLTPVAIRSFLSIGADKDGALNFDNYTDQSLQLFLNEVDFLINGEATAIRGIKNSQSFFQVYPNPAMNGVIKIKLKNVEFNDAKVQIYNVVGHLVYSAKLYSSQNHSFQTKLTKGMYFVTLTVNEETYSKKVLMD